ncbi:MAG: hypothetical protein JWN04_3995 [Myxococcaceae bacterium]|nr:hypothetical protein [Myxococcaceae bacterium]
MSIKNEQKTISGGRRTYVMPYGLHEGVPFKQIPSDYLYWVATVMVGDPEKHVLALHAARALAARRWEWEGQQLRASSVEAFLSALGLRRLKQKRVEANLLQARADQMEAFLTARAGYLPYAGREDEYMVRYEGENPVETVELQDVGARLGFAA